MTGKGKILIADDEPANLMLLGELLKREFEVFVAADGTKAVEAAKRTGPDLILLDVMMPGLDGYSACRMLKADPELADVPVIFITAKSDSDDVVLGFEVGGQDYITKPFNPQELHARVRTHIDLRIAQARLREDALRLEEMNRKLATALERMEIMAREDPLTGIANRRYILDRIGQEYARTARYGKNLSIAIADIDDFKAINDTFGHECGDLVLQRISAICASAIRPEDMVARWGGEEFLFLFPETAGDGALVIAEKLRSLIESDNFTYHATRVPFTITAGVAGIDLKLSIDENIRRADDALYEGKRTIKNSVHAAK